MPEPKWSRSNRWLTVILITPEEFGAEREKVRLALDAENIEARPVWKPMNMQPVFDCGLHAKRRKRTQNKNRYKASPGEIRSAQGKGGWERCGAPVEHPKGARVNGARRTVARLQGALS